MTDRNPFRIHKRSIAAILGGVLIGLGLVLQWIEVPLARFLSRNFWLFDTLISGACNMISMWLSYAAWAKDLRYWPLLLVIAGGAILLSRCSQTNVKR